MFCCETKEKVHDVLVKVNMGRKGAGRSGRTTTLGLLSEVRCV